MPMWRRHPSILVLLVALASTASGCFDCTEIAHRLWLECNLTFGHTAGPCLSDLPGLSAAACNRSGAGSYDTGCLETATCAEISAGGCGQPAPFTGDLACLQSCDREMISCGTNCGADLNDAACFDCLNACVVVSEECGRGC